MFKTDVPYDREVVDSVLSTLEVNLSQASIREMTLLVSELENKLKTRFLRMEFGIPGLEPNPIGPEAETSALRRPKTVSNYSVLTGLPALKEEGSKFLKNYLNLEIPTEFVLPTVGSMQGGFLSQAICGRRKLGKDQILFVDPSFSVHHIQCKFLGLRTLSVDLYERKTWLDEVEKYCSEGSVAAILFSSPNNPTWMILTEDELKRLGEICTRHDVIAVEDAAYFGMDFRRDYSQQGQPPYPPTVARYTENYIYLLSASKIFSYAGQRIGLTFISPKLAVQEFPDLQKTCGKTRFLDAFVLTGLYCTTTGTPQTPQYGLAALLHKVNRGEYNFLQVVSVYAERSHFMKKVMLENGFHLVYADDLGEPLADGFFFTFAYPGMTGGELVKELLYYGISATTLAITGSKRNEAVRACVSLIGKEDFKLFESRVRQFAKDHPCSNP